MTTIGRLSLTGTASSKAARLMAAQFAFLETKEGAAEEKAALKEREIARRAMTAVDWRLLSYACGIVMGWAPESKARKVA